MPDPAVLAYPFTEEDEFEIGSEDSFLFGSGERIKNAWSEYFQQNCSPKRVQPNVARVQQIDAEAYAERFTRGSKSAFQRCEDRAVFSLFSCQLKANQFEVIDPDRQSSSISSYRVRVIEQLFNELTELEIKELSGPLIQLLADNNSDSKKILDVSSVCVLGRPRSADVTFLNSARRLESSGYIDKALDMIYAHFDALLCASDLERIDSLLASVEPRNFGTDLLLGLLTITLPARSKLQSRQALFYRIEKELHIRGDWEDNLLAGLE